MITDRNLCNAGCGPVTETSHFTLLPLFPAYLLVHRLRFSVSVSSDGSPHPSRSETWSIASGFPLMRLADAHKWSYCSCNVRLIGWFGCLFCYCPLIGAQGVLTVYIQTHVGDSTGVRRKGKCTLKAMSQDGWGHEPKRRRQMEDWRHYRGRDSKGSTVSD